MKSMKEEMINLKKKIEELEKNATSLANESSGAGVDPKKLKAFEDKAKAAKDKFSQLLKATLKTHKDDLKEIKVTIAGINKNILGALTPLLRNVAEKIAERQRAATEELRAKYIKEMNERKKLFNLVQELKGNIRVFCRVRPLNNSEKESCVSITNDGLVAVENKDNHSVVNFEFDNVFGELNSIVLSGQGVYYPKMYI